MKKFVLTLTFIAGLCAFGLTGCGGGEATVVVPEDDAGDTGLTEVEMAEYEQEMEAEQGN